MTHMFVPGPVDVAPEVLQAMAKPMLPHRSKEYEAIHRSAAEKSQKVFYTDYRVFIGTHSGSGMQETGVRNLADKDVLCCVNGAFSKRWFDVAVSNGKEADQLTAELGKPILPEMLRDALKKAGVAAMPKTWDEFFAAADKLKAAGLVPVAHGGQNWQDFTTFESVVLGVGGAKFYNDALVKLDQKALTSATMTKSLETFRKIKSYTDAASPGRDWNLATAMVIKGDAAFQFMGDWAKGEFAAAGKTPGKDYICAAAPGTGNAYTFNVDSFAMFKLKDANAQKAQADLAAAIMGTQFQEVFNLNKGSIPVRLKMDMAKFDDCAKLSAKDFVDTAKTGGLLPSVAHGMAVKPAAEGAIKDAVSQFWNNDKISVADGVKSIAKAAATK